MKIKALVKSPNFKHLGGGKFEMNLLIEVEGGESDDIMKLLALTGQEIEFQPILKGHVAEEQELDFSGYQIDEAAVTGEE